MPLPKYYSLQPLDLPLNQHHRPLSPTNPSLIHFYYSWTNAETEAGKLGQVWKYSLLPQHCVTVA